MNNHSTKLDEALERLADEIAHTQAVANGTHICTDDCPLIGGKEVVEAAPKTQVKATYELEVGDILANDGAEIVAVVQVIGSRDYAITLRWTSEYGSKHIGARVEPISMTWEVVSK
jgi:hypothetical protein